MVHGHRILLLYYCTTPIHLYYTPILLYYTPILLYSYTSMLLLPTLLYYPSACSTTPPALPTPHSSGNTTLAVPTMRLLVCCCVLSTACLVAANVEKTVFLGPSPVTLPNVPPLAVLSPLDPILPTRLPVTFPSPSLPRGLDSWYLVRGLHAGVRYEVRVCWPATVSPARLMPWGAR